jgi:hypothetical protein
MTVAAELFAGTASIASWIVLWSPLPDWSTVRRLLTEPGMALAPAASEEEEMAEQRQSRASSSVAAAALAGELTRFNISR